MLQNSLFTNLQLTGVIAKLACYPQPLITSFLLNTNLVFQPSVRSLHQVRRETKSFKFFRILYTVIYFQVLSALRHKVDAYACSVENFESLLIRGQKFLFQRDKRYQSDRRRSRGAFLRNKVADEEDASSLQNGNTPTIKHGKSYKFLSCRKYLCFCFVLRRKENGFDAIFQFASFFQPVERRRAQKKIRVFGKRWFQKYKL